MATQYSHTAPDHEKDGMLEVNVSNLQGVLASEQYPKVHDHKNSLYGHGGGINLADLLDVDTTGMEDGYILYWDLADQKFKFKQVTGGGMLFGIDGGSATSVYGINDHLDGGPAIDNQDSVVDGGGA